MTNIKQLDNKIDTLNTLLLKNKSRMTPEMIQEIEITIRNATLERIYLTLRK